MVWVLVTGEDTTFYVNSLHVLRPAGYEVVGSPDGATALQLLVDTAREMVVLLRKQMGRVDAVEFLTEVAPNDVLRFRHTYVLLDGPPSDMSPELQRYLDLLAVPMVDTPADLSDADRWDDLFEVLAVAARKLPPHGTR